MIARSAALALTLLVTSFQVAHAGGAAPDVQVRPARVGLFGAPSEKRIAKQSWNAFVQQNPNLKAYRLEKSRGIPTGLRIGGVATAGLGSFYGAALALVNGAFGGTQSIAHVAMGIAGVGVGAGVAAFVGAKKVMRNANTVALERLMKDGVPVSQDQLRSWNNAGIISIEPVSAQ